MPKRIKILTIPSVNKLNQKFLESNIIISDGSPVYNLIYDKSGRHVISAADDG